ncbi:MAG: ATP-binding protein [Ferruginibacter sp.]|nr:ATP-binding protein [Ferruginibacter sp.]
MKKIATPKQTGQGGPGFENKVVAYFMACMLTQTPPFAGQHGLITRIDLQVAGDGWLFDDALLTIEHNHITTKVAVSIKSNQQFSRNGIPGDLNRLLWEQYLGDHSNVFQPASDTMCLVESGVPASVTTNLNTLLLQAKAQDPEDLHKRLYTKGYSSKTIQAIYDSFHCPVDLAQKHSLGTAATGKVLKNFLQVEMDFERVTSLWEARSIDLCRLLLDSSNAAEAKQLFDNLSHLSLQLAKSAGFVDNRFLLAHLRGSFVLAGIRDYKKDWDKLQEHNGGKLSLTRSQLGNKTIIDRTASVVKIDELLQSKSICLIQGISGSGKTALLKFYAERKLSGSKIIWLDATDLDDPFESALQLQHALAEIMKFVPSREAYLFIDGAERLYEEKQQQRLSLLINTVQSNKLPWKIIITCPTDSVDRVMGTFNQFNVNTEVIGNFNMPSLSDETVLELIKEYPELASFLLDKAVRNILNNLKLLDKLVFNIKRITSLAQIESPGETHLIDFIWQEEIENTTNGIQKSSFLKTAAEKQADQLLTGISTSEFDASNIAIADPLIKTSFLKMEQQKIYFIHDLYSDWARYQLLHAHSGKLSSFLNGKKLLSPLWSKAIRLYGLSLLEKDTTGQNWKKAFNSFADNTAQHIIIQNLLLESLFLSPNALQILNQQKELLLADEGKLFKRMLKLFLIGATSPNPEILRLAKQLGGFTEPEASSYDRIPVFPYWIDMLLFLHANKDESLKLALLTVTNIALMWLEKTPINFICRKEAGDIALQSARFIFEEQEKGRYVDDKITEPVYKSLLAGYNENPELVEDLCLRISKRKKEEITTEEAAQTDSGYVSIMDRLPYSKREAKQWEDGPAARVDNSFQKLCLETNALLPLLFANPQLGKEILLAVLIDEPDTRYLGMNRHDDDYSIHNPIGWYPPFFLRGPFIHFLRTHPDEGIDFIIRLTNFATQRWMENDREINKTEQYLRIENGDQSKVYYGDFYVFGWNKDVGNAPHSLVSILMAFEQFLYEEIDNDRPVGKYVEYALNHSNSLAIAGLLITVGKYSPLLFLKELRMLLPFTQLFYWDQQMGFGNHSLSNNDLPKSWKEQIDKWKDNRHRGFPLKDTLINIFLYNSDFELLAGEMLPLWQKELDSIQANDYSDVYLLQMIPRFKKENYQEKQIDGRTYFEFVEPAEISDKLKTGRESSLAILQESQVSQKMEMMIEQQLPFDLAGAEYLWKKIQQWETEIKPQDIEHDYVVGSPRTNILSSVAVLLNAEDIWINEHAEYLQWIKSFFEKCIDERLAGEEHSDRYGTTFDWNVKLAALLPGLWKKNIADKSVRKTVAGILILFNDTTSNTFFSSAVKLFQWNDPSFVQVQNMYLSYYNEKREAFRNSYPQPGQVKPIQEKHLNAFTESQVSDKFIEWPTLIDFHKTRLLLSNLPNFKEIAGTDQRQYVLSMVRQSLVRMEARLLASLDEHKHSDDHPDDFDRTVLIRVADCLPYLTDEEDPDFLWGEIVKYGYFAREWNAVFFNAFLILQVPHLEIYPKVIALLHKIILFTNKWATWETKKAFRRWDDFRDCILGLDPKTVSFWKIDYSGFVKDATVLYQYWFKKNLHNPHTLSGLMSFMVTDSGASFLEGGLEQVKNFFSAAILERSKKPPEGKVYVGNKELDDKLLSTLIYLWEHKRDLVKGSTAMFAAYRELLQYLVAIENVAAIELHQRLGQT